jgi:hypothetical protein
MHYWRFEEDARLRLRMKNLVGPPSNTAAEPLLSPVPVREGKSMKVWQPATIVGLMTTLALALATNGARAEVNEVRISKGFGILYLPLIVMQDQKLLEMQTAKAGLGDIGANGVIKLSRGNKQHALVRAV